ncbi:MAG TPA: hypothetical protein VJ983_06580 [candidate division Zixibacteria bacterium]|nr:hypothetical protein [candidate division Zixibacteria bacterium]
MANTKVQHEVESWILEDYLPKTFGGRFTEQPLKLTWGGVFKFDAVSDDGKIVGNISTSTAVTSGGRPAVGQFHKIKADILYLLHVGEAERRMLIFTEQNMVDHFAKEQESGRLPDEIELHLIALPAWLRRELEKSRGYASKEVRPNGKQREAR